MKQFNLEEYLKNPSRKVVTRKGIPVKIHCTNFVTCKPVIAEIDGRGYSQSFTKEGRYFGDTDESSEVLFFAPEKHEGWINVHKVENTPYLDTCIWPTEEYAKKGAKYTDNYVATVKIEWEE